MGDTKQNATPYTKERCLKAAIVELVDDHETLKREANELREHNSYLETRVSEESDYTTLLTRHNALVEAVAWERECRYVRNVMRLWYWWPEQDEAQGSYIAARAEVDRLIGESEGEG